LINLLNKEMLVYYSLGYIDDEIFTLINECTNHTLIIKPTRAVSLEADHCILNFYAPLLQESLYKILLITYGDNYKIEDQPFKLQFQGNKIIKLSLEEKKIQLWQIKGAKKLDKVSFYTCLKECSEHSSENDFIHRINIIDELDTNELLIHAFLSLLHRFKYINLEKNKISSLGTTFIKRGYFKFEKEIFLFFELLKLGFIKGDNFKPSNLEEIENIDIKGFTNSLVMSEKECIDFQHFPDEKFLNKKEKEFLKGLVNFHKMFCRRNKLSLYKIETSVDKIYESLSSVKVELRSLNLANYADVSREIDLYVVKNAFHIKILSKIAALSNYDYVNHSKLCDYDMYQFTEIVQYMALGLRHFLSSQLLYVFHKSNTKSKLSLLHKAFNKFPFSRLYAAECGALIKIIVIKSILYNFVKEKFGIVLHGILKEISCNHIASSYNLDNKYEQMISNSLIFVSTVIEFCKENLEQFSDIHSDLMICRELLVSYIDLVGLKIEEE